MCFYDSVTVPINLCLFVRQSIVVSVRCSCHAYELMFIKFVVCKHRVFNTTTISVLIPQIKFTQVSARVIESSENKTQSVVGSWTCL